MRQYVACKFRPTDTRAYTYHNDGEPVGVGDFVKVPDGREDGWKTVEVVDVSDAEPRFATKPIFGRFNDVPDQPEAA